MQLTLAFMLVSAQGDEAEPAEQARIQWDEQLLSDALEVSSISMTRPFDVVEAHRQGRTFAVPAATTGTYGMPYPVPTNHYCLPRNQSHCYVLVHRSCPEAPAPPSWSPCWRQRWACGSRRSSASQVRAPLGQPCYTP